MINNILMDGIISAEILPMLSTRRKVPRATQRVDTRERLLRRRRLLRTLADAAYFAATASSFENYFYVTRATECRAAHSDFHEHLSFTLDTLRFLFT